MKKVKSIFYELEKCFFIFFILTFSLNSFSEQMSSETKRRHKRPFDIRSLISISTQLTTIKAGEQKRFTAMETYSDGTVENITNSVYWTSSDLNVGIISNSGLFTALFAGKTDVNASKDGNTSNIITIVVNEIWTLKGSTVGKNGENQGDEFGFGMAEVILLENEKYRMYYGASLKSGLTEIRYAESSD